MTERDAYYYEEWNTFCRWEPAIMHGRKPPAKTSEGRNRKIRNIQKLPDEYRGMKLSVLQALATAKAGPFAEGAPC